MLNIVFLNIGKADAIIISINNKYIMIDTGEEKNYDDINKYFIDKNIKELEYLIITHFDKDHVGSAHKIIDSINIKNILQNNISKDSIYYNKYIESINNKNIKSIIVDNIIKIKLQDVDIIIYGANKIYGEDKSNNSSLIVSLKYKNNKFLFMGDAKDERIKDFNNINKDKYDFIKIPYHGRELKELDNLINNRNIKYAVITSSIEKKESIKTIEVLDKYNIEYYLTRNGKININSDGKMITVEQEKEYE